MEGATPTVRVIIPLSLRQFCTKQNAGRSADLSVSAGNVREVLSQLSQQHPQLHVRICDEHGDPRQHINVFVNDDHVRAKDGLSTRLKEGDLVTILPAVSGG